MFGQQEYELRYVGNYFDQIYGFGTHPEPITFHEFLGKSESAFMYMPEFMQTPTYVPTDVGLHQIEEAARQATVEYIMTEFDRLFLGNQDYVRWAQLFENKCLEICPAYWAQVNLLSFMTSAELEQDEMHNIGTVTGNATRLGGQATEVTQSGTSSTVGEVKASQDNTATQTTDGVSRDAQATTLTAENEVTDEVEYDWTKGTDNVRESHTRAGDTEQHMESQTNSTSTTDTSNTSNSVTSFNNMQDQNQSTNENTSEYTNKQFAQERRLFVDVARDLLPLAWLRAQLRPMFNMIY